MNACSMLNPCHSVDYHANSNACYFGNHPGEPTIEASGFWSAHSLGRRHYAGASSYVVIFLLHSELSLLLCQSMRHTHFLDSAALGFRQADH